MDTSETYIKMSHKAFPNPTAMPSGRVERLRDNIFIDDNGQWWADYEGWFIPLYRQDQLQEMRPNKISLAYADLHCAVRGGFYDGYIDKDGFGYGTPYETDEQLWLAFIMKEKYNKTWNGNDWICPG